MGRGKRMQETGESNQRQYSIVVKKHTASDCLVTNSVPTFTSYGASDKSLNFTVPPFLLL